MGCTKPSASASACLRTRIHVLGDTCFGRHASGKGCTNQPDQHHVCPLSERMPCPKVRPEDERKGAAASVHGLSECKRVSKGPFTALPAVGCCPRVLKVDPAAGRGWSNRRPGVLPVLEAGFVNLEAGMGSGNGSFMLWSTSNTASYVLDWFWNAEDWHALATCSEQKYLRTRKRGGEGASLNVYHVMCQHSCQASSRIPKKWWSQALEKKSLRLSRVETLKSSIIAGDHQDQQTGRDWQQYTNSMKQSFLPAL